jgi:hypothetical protein
MTADDEGAEIFIRFNVVQRRFDFIEHRRIERIGAVWAFESEPGYSADRLDGDGCVRHLGADRVQGANSLSHTGSGIDTVRLLRAAMRSE